MNGNATKYVKKLISGTRVTIPQELCNELGLKQGDTVILEKVDGYIKITPATIKGMVNDS